MNLDVIGIIGIILLIGIVKENGIMLVDFAIRAERERGLSAEDAIHEACLLRFRPILMTTLCAMLGGVPLALGTGTGSELRQPQVLTLFSAPVVYIYMDKLAGLAAGGRRRRPRRKSSRNASLWQPELHAAMRAWRRQCSR